ncbi:MAG: hypothetical protein HYT87_04475 [Nitrospirae bacterium]|nr:hypothetical protein [Nitrospirota bacterium]
MRVAFITNPDGWEVPVYAEALRKAHHSMVGVLAPLSPRPLFARIRRNRAAGRRLLRRSERAILWAAWSARSRRFLRDHSALRAYCKKHKFPLILVWSLSSARAAKFLRRLKPDLLFSASLSHLVPQSLLSVPRIAAVNIHGGLLPEYGGLDSAYWALQDRQSNAGVTFHTLTERFDSGRIILRRSLTVRGTPTPDALAEKLIRLAAKSLPECVDRIKSGRFETQTPVRSRLRPRPAR